MVLPAKEQVVVEVRDLNGQLLQTNEFESAYEGRNQFSIQRNGLQPGLYMVTVRTSTQQQTMRVLIAR